MKEYIITVAAAALVAALTDILSPEEWGKYIKIVVGFLILSIVLTPVAKLKNAELALPYYDSEITDEPIRDKVTAQCEQNIADDIEERVKKEFGIECAAAVKLDLDENRNITGVKSILISVHKNPPKMVERIREIYGCSKVGVKIE